LVSTRGCAQRLPIEKRAALKPAFLPRGEVTAGNSSQISDGAAASMMSADRAKALRLKNPWSRIRTTAVVGVRPEIMAWGLVPATQKALSRAGPIPQDIALREINEAFAAQVLACNAELRIHEDRLNVNGGAIAIGHSRDVQVHE
jgi:acetyl-CoA acetyltransferase